MVYSGRIAGIAESTLLPHDPETADDSDLVSGMLTAIRDFAQDTFGRDRVGELDLAGLLLAFLLMLWIGGLLPQPSMVDLPR